MNGACQFRKDNFTILQTMKNYLYPILKPVREKVYRNLVNWLVQIYLGFKLILFNTILFRYITLNKKSFHLVIGLYKSK